MANALGIDLGRVYQQAEAIKSQRANRLAAERSVDMTQRIETARRNHLAGDPGAMTELMAIDPGQADMFRKAIAGFTPDRAAAERQSLEDLGALAAAALQSPDPAKAWGELRAVLPREIAAKVPEAWNEPYARMLLARITKADELFGAIAKREAAATEADTRMRVEEARTERKQTPPARAADPKAPPPPPLDFPADDLPPPPPGFVVR